ncbi:MAG: alpha-amylase [Candidatus Marinimicrobia bacterium]|nr:alpha-amylase [Candidatus Neomarinimicrobiota bacterium]
MKSIKDIDFDKLRKDNSYYPSPAAWEDQVVYFIMVDRFSNGKEVAPYNPPRDFENALKNDKERKRWEQSGDTWVGGDLPGVISKLDYLQHLGVTALWISPVFKQVSYQQTYHGYGIQNFLEIDPHFGTKEDLKKLVAEAHTRGMYVILDIIFNHTGDIFAYEQESPQYTGEVYPVRAFRDKEGNPTIAFDKPDLDMAWPDGGVWPAELMSPGSFTRKGAIVNWDAYPEYIEGDFFSLKNINTGNMINGQFQVSTTLKILTECYKYWIALADIDGFRLDTVKHLDPGATQYFVSEIHEFAQYIGKNDFYIIGEITGGMEFAIETLRKTGLDAALGINKIPEKLENVAKGYIDPIEFFSIFTNSELLGDDEHKWYRDNVITMFDDHDMIIQSGIKSRFCADRTTSPLLLNALFLNLMSPGIPCIYYGTEQGFDGKGNSDKYVREAMFESSFGAFRSTNRHFFNQKNSVFLSLSKMIQLRKKFIVLRQGRIYQREVSYNAEHFEFPHKLGVGRHSGVIAWSRIMSHEEILCVINCDLKNDRSVYVIVDGILNKESSIFKCIFSTDNLMLGQKVKVELIENILALRVTIPKSGCVAFWNIEK